MKEEHFFEKQTMSSRIKASIVSEYFPSYCKIIAKRHVPKQIRYIDLFAGPGVYDDGNASTPILIARYCQNNDFLRNKVRLIFNDNMYSATLEQNFYKEHFGKSTVGCCKEINKFLMQNTHENNRNEYPSLLFIDPFGYKGIETRVLAEFLKNWGNEIFLFVNTKRIHPALENDKFESLMLDLFPTTLDQIRLDRRFKANVSERLSLIINSLGNEYETLLGGKVFYTAFKFQEEDIKTTSHYILHITKGARGYDLIKTIYNDFANVGTFFDGVNTYTFDAKKLDSTECELFDVNSANIDLLKNMIYEHFNDCIITAYELFETHHKANLYSRSHYTEALRRLVEEGKITSTYTDGKKHQKSVLISKYCILNFKTNG